MTEKEITFENFDKFNRKDFANKLTTAISRFYPFFDEAIVLSLNAKFGSGKSTFLKMWRHDLEKQDYKVIYINAWETDFDDEPLIPIISTLLNNLDGKKEKKVFTALQGVLGAATLASNQFVSQTIGLDILSMLKQIEENLKESNVEAIGRGIYQEFSFKEDAYKELKKELELYVEKLEKKPLIIFVDELDRVRPNYAVKFLEAIKHIFSVPGICFILAVDREQLEISVKQLYGNIDFQNYYMRFINREANLPDLNKINIKTFIEHKTQEFFAVKLDSKIYFPFTDDQKRDVFEFMHLMCRGFQFVPRQIEALFRVFSQFMAISHPSKPSKILWVRASAFLIAVLIKDPLIYHKIGKSNLSKKEIHEYLNSIVQNLPKKSDKDSLSLYALSSFLTTTNQEDIIDLSIPFLRRKENIPDRKEMIHLLSRPINDFGEIYEESVFNQIYKLLEEWTGFIDQF